MTVCPATVSVPERTSPPLSATVNVVDPPPLPLAPSLMVIQLTLLDAVQVHPGVVVTDTLWSLFFAPTSKLVGVTTYAQTGAASCEMVTVCPAMLSVPLRALPVLASTA